MFKRAVSLGLFIFIASALRAGTTFSSGPARVSLIELYTSEGCSSCPSAEAWLADLRTDARLWKEIVPVVFHVNYWDRLGWRDVYASREFTDRQRALASGWPAGSVYTPCFVRDGLEWRTRDLRREKSTPAAGTLTLTRVGDGRWRVTFTLATDAVTDHDAKNFDAHLALLGGGIVSDVRAGENAGRKLTHEFVALSMKSAAFVVDDAGTFGVEFTLAQKEPRTMSRHAIAAWITRRGELAPLQAVGGWME